MQIKTMLIMVLKSVFKFVTNKMNEFQTLKFTGMYMVFSFIGLVGRVFANGLGDQGSIPGRVIPKIFKNGT